MILFCIDIGNTHTHFGLVGPNGPLRFESMPSRSLDASRHPILAQLKAEQESPEPVSGLACCSVVPERTTALLAQVEQEFPDLPRFQLTHESKLGFPLAPSHPEQIGHDRLANAVAAHVLCGAPAIAVDSGTAVTCDVITPYGGFEGGIIAPGLGLMRESLHEKTAQLPRIEDDREPASAIGRNTIEAMTIGCTVGFRGLVAALVKAQRDELAARGLGDVPVVLTGGSALALTPLIEDGVRLVPGLTLRGLYQAFLLNRPKDERFPSDAGNSDSARE
jgi:type III pantothenate kinase